MARVLFLVNHEIVIYNFRLEIVERLLEDGHQVYVSSPFGERIKELISIGVKYCKIDIERHGFNPFNELKLLNEYKKIIDNIKPDIILGFTIKPNIYGAIAARKYHVPFVANITGLGSALEKSGIKQKILIILYRYAFKDIKKVFFQNVDNKNFFIENRIIKNKYEILPGSGVNLKRYPYFQYPSDNKVEFAFISRIMKEKGIDQYLEAAQVITQKNNNVIFHICGFCEEDYNQKLIRLTKQNPNIQYHGMIKDVASFMSKMHCIVHPSYYPEGLSNVLLESSACGRPIITTDRAGCREVIIDRVNGYLIKANNANDLIEKIKTFLNLSYEEKRQMGINGRKLVEEKFDRQIVVDYYLKEIQDFK